MGLSGIRGSALSCLAALFTLTITACAPTPLELVQRGKLRQSFLESRESDVPTQAKIAHAILDDEAPSIELHTIEGAELAGLVGSYTARQLEPAWLLLRATATTRAREFPRVYVNVTLGRDPTSGATEKEIPVYAMQPAAIAALTGERIAKGYMGSVYGGGVCSSGGILCVLLFPLAPLTEHKVGETYVPPTEEQLRLSAPRAVRLAKVLNDSCNDPGHCVRHFIVRRPRDEAVPLSLRIRVVLSDLVHQHARTMSDFSWKVGAVATREVPPGPTLAQRLALTVEPTKMTSGVELAEHRFRRERLKYTPQAEEALRRLQGHGDHEPDLGEFALPSRPEEVAAGEGPTLIPLVPLSTPPLAPPTVATAPKLPPAAAAKFATAWPEAVNAVELTEERLQVFALEFNPTNEYFGLDRPSLDKARAAVAALAAIIGADDPRVRDFSARLDRAEDRAMDYRAEAMAQVKHRQATCKHMQLITSVVETSPGRCVESGPPGTRVCTFSMNFISFSSIGQHMPYEKLRVVLTDGRIVAGELDPPYFQMAPDERSRRVPMRVTIPPWRTPSTVPVLPQTLILQVVPSHLCALSIE